ncbi:MAG: hypothetical protein JWO15_1578 [Sphingomonadales bacterium]|nr:hypothetical protein [Sphingomonadales bacterium]
MIKIRGMSSWITGEKFVVIDKGDATARVPLQEFSGRSPGVFKLIGLQGVVLIKRKDMDYVLDQAAELKFFPEGKLIEGIGWSAPYFALPDGTVMSPEGVEPPQIAFGRMANKCSQAGSLKGWKKHVAAPLTGHMLAMFVLMLAFMPPLLRLSTNMGNIGFELVGGKGIGKSTIQQLVASILGATGHGEDGNYWITFNTTLNALETAMAAHSDLPMILEEANLFFAGETAAKRASAMKALAFKLSAGDEKERYGMRSAGHYRFAYLSSSNEPLTDLIGKSSDVAKAASDRLITLTIGADRRYGVFDRFPEECESASIFAAQLTAAATKNHGKAMRRYLQRLVNARAADEKLLRARIRNYQSAFRRKARVDANSGSAVRVADAFGLVYAAGCLAQAYGALPKSFECGLAVLHCYQLSLSATLPARAFADRLRELASDQQTVADDASLSRRQVSASTAFLRRKASGSEILIRSAMITTVFPDWATLRKQADVQALSKGEAGHRTVKRSLGRNKEVERVFCFTLPPQNAHE